jgi:hypothetical protein
MLGRELSNRMIRFRPNAKPLPPICRPLHKIYPRSVTRNHEPKILPYFITEDFASHSELVARFYVQHLGYITVRILISPQVALFISTIRFRASLHSLYGLVTCFRRMRSTRNNLKVTTQPRHSNGKVYQPCKIVRVPNSKFIRLYLRKR